MPIIDSISWTGATADDVAYRYPNVSLKYGSQVIVMENQWAVFFRDGKALDIFGPGRHTITSNNIPILTAAARAIGIIGDIFECEVVFVNNSQLRANFGGKAYSAPSGQIQYQAEVGFYGYAIYKVEDPKLFVTEFFGNRQATTSKDVEEYIRGFVKERVIDAFANHDIFKLVGEADETTDRIALLVNDEARRIGLIIIDTVFEGLNIPEEARRFASGMGQQAMTLQYMKETAEVIPPGGGGAAAGIGAGMGFAMMNQMAKGAQQPVQPQQVTVCPHCNTQNQMGQKFCGNCGKNLNVPKTIKCSNCNADVPEKMKFCGNCGKPVKTEAAVCPKCERSNPPGMKFCGNCGEKLS